MEVYRINEWNLHYEHAGSRKVKRLRWVAIPNRFDGRGYCRLMMLDDGLALFGAWVLIVELASRMPVRGVFLKDGRPVTAEDIAIQTRSPVETVTRALEVLTGDDIGWMAIVDWDGLVAPATLLGDADTLVGYPDTSSQCVGSGTPQKIPPHNRTGQDRTEPDTTEQNNTGQDGAPQGGAKADPKSGESFAVAKPTGPGFSQGDCPDRAGIDSTTPAPIFRNWFVAKVACAMAIDSKRQLANRHAFMAIAREVYQKPQRFTVADELIALAKEKGEASLDNPAAAWQTVAQERLGIPPVKERKR